MRHGSARSLVRRARALVPAAAAVALVAGVAAPAQAATSGAQVTVSAGALSQTTPDFQAISATLTGAAQTIATTPATPWSVVDARGTGADWSVVASASDLVSTGTPNRTIPASNLAITTGTVTAGSGADAVAGITGVTALPFTLPTGVGQTNVALLSAVGPHRGSYTYTPRLDVTIPANAQASYAGSPYTATVTVTIS
jgi:hypothetical protein